MRLKVLLLLKDGNEEEILRKALGDYDVRHAYSPEEAQFLLDSQKDIRYLFLDGDLPGGEALKLLERIGEASRTRHFRTLVLAGEDAGEEELSGFLREGAAEILSKPLSLPLLSHRLAIQENLLMIRRQTEAKVEKELNLLQIILDQAPVGISFSFSHELMDMKGVRTWDINPMYEKITGWSKEALAARGWGAITHPEDLEEDLRLLGEVQAGLRNYYDLDKRYLRPDGTPVWVHLSLAAIRGEGLPPYSHVAILQDISKRKELEARLRESERSKTVLLSNLPGMAYRCAYNREWTMEYVSQGVLELLGCTPENLLGEGQGDYSRFILAEHQERVFAEISNGLQKNHPFRLEYEIRTAAGKRKWVLELGQGVFDDQGKIQALEGIIIDISENKAREREILFLSSHDPLTGLPNRRELVAALTRCAEEEEGRNTALLVLNFNKLRSLSLGLGDVYREQVFLSLIRDLQPLEREGQTLFQIANSRLAFLIRSYHGKEALESFSREVQEALQGNEVVQAMGYGLGILEASQCSRDPEVLLKDATIASEYAIRTRGLEFSCMFYEDALKATIQRENIIKEELISLLRGQGGSRLYLNFQPVVELTSGKIQAFEALARMESPILGSISPGEFIPLAEEIQIIFPLTRRIMKLAAAFLSKLEGLPVGVSVNISPIHLLREDFLPDLQDQMNRSGINPRQLILEVTENAFTYSETLIARRIREVKELGIRIAIDDFGTGYSSLSRVQEIQGDILKIDKEFIDRITPEGHQSHITREIIAIGQKLGMTVVAEGVEEAFQAAYLEEAGCAWIQGYHFSKPLLEEEAMDLLRKCGQC